MWWLGLIMSSALAVDANDKPAILLLETGLGSPTGLYGARGGLSFGPKTALELGGGLGGLGVKTTGTFRFFSRDDEWQRGVFSGAIGPVVALWSEELGFAMPVRAEEGQLLYSVWADAQGSWELRTRLGFSFRISLGLSVNLAHNQDGLCAGVPQGRDEPSSLCNPPHWPTGPMLATAPVLPHLGLSYGWAF